MNERRRRADSDREGRDVRGRGADRLSASTAISGDQYTLPAVGAIPGVALGGVGLLAGFGLYTGVKRYSKRGCGCAGDCNC